MNTADKLRLFIALVFVSQQKALADALEISPGTVNAWLQGGSIRSDILGRLYQLGLSANWLIDSDNTDPRQMFANNEAGRELARKHFGLVYLSMEENMKPAEGKGAERSGGEPGEVAPRISLERTDPPKKPGSKGPKKNNGPKEKAK